MRSPAIFQENIKMLCYVAPIWKQWTSGRLGQQDLAGQINPEHLLAILT